MLIISKSKKEMKIHFNHPLNMQEIGVHGNKCFLRELISRTWYKQNLVGKYSFFEKFKEQSPNFLDSKQTSTLHACLLHPLANTALSL